MTIFYNIKKMRDKYIFIKLKISFFKNVLYYVNKNLLYFFLKKQAIS